MYEDFLAGWVAGGAGLIVGHPMDTIKARLQTMTIYTGIWDCAVKTVRKESVYGLYKGMLIPFITAGAMHSILFSGYGIALRYLHPGEKNVESRKDLPMSDILIASICSTMAQVGPMIPVELIKTKLQVQLDTVSRSKRHAATVFSGPVECCRQIWRQSGPRGFFKGGTVVFARDNIGYLFYIPVYEGLLRQFRSFDLDNIWTQLFSGGCAGVSGWISVCPLEVVKNRIQAAGGNEKRKPLKVATEILKTEGFTAFYRGGLAISIRGFTVNSVIFLVYENCLRILHV
ncbi:unnamed protein product [Caenorhabditis angaria]|uniref:Solute carrier family 25 member 45 n=1 Tax=Caenorhabditis angaria TaxID=860376 RepID=A0A9P1IS37_9PELO|nr:unnamed protein product [Caenorhabditis angaria]